jgi:pimeloyl-ACP methyl ester carboxylesterase
VSSAVESFEPGFEQGAVAEMRARLHATRWPEPVAGGGWEWGVDLGYLRALCEWWAEEYDPDGLLERLGEWPSFRWCGIHFLHASPEPPAAGGNRLPVLLIHGWPGAPLEFRGMIGPLLAAGHEVIVPSLPGYGFSAATDPPLSGSGVAELFIELMAEIGYGRYAVHGGDWGAYIAGNIAFEEPESVAAFHTNGPGLLPLPGDLEEPPLSEEEIDFAQRARRSQLTNGSHQIVLGLAPDTLGVGLGDSPAGLAAWLVPRYRAWSDCDGDLESRFSKRDLCDLLTFYWATGTVASSMRTYAATRADRWRLGAGERITVPTAVGDFPGELVRPPRSWTARICSDIRRWTEMPSGGHFAAWEEPGLLSEDLIAFLGEL